MTPASGMREMRLTCRNVLTNQTLTKTNFQHGLNLPLLDNNKVEEENDQCQTMQIEEGLMLGEKYLDF